MRYRRSGIIIRTPRTPPQRDRTRVRSQSISKPRRTRAGRVKATPAAIDSPAEPVVWTTVFSRIEARPPRAREKARNIVMEMTAIGTEAETVSPTRRARYTEEAPKTTPSSEPIRRARRVSSGSFCSGATKGLKPTEGAGVSAKGRTSEGRAAFYIAPRGPRRGVIFPGVPGGHGRFLRALRQADPDRGPRPGARGPGEQPPAAPAPVRLRGHRHGPLLLERRVPVLRDRLPPER